MTPSLSERAELTQKFSDPVYRGYEIGALSREEAREELKSRGEPLGAFTKIDPAKKDPEKKNPAEG